MQWEFTVWTQVLHPANQGGYALLHVIETTHGEHSQLWWYCKHKMKSGQVR